MALSSNLKSALTKTSTTTLKKAATTTPTTTTPTKTTTTTTPTKTSTTTLKKAATTTPTTTTTKATPVAISGTNNSVQSALNNTVSSSAVQAAKNVANVKSQNTTISPVTKSNTGSSNSGGGSSSSSSSKGVSWASVSPISTTHGDTSGSSNSGGSSSSGGTISATAAVVPVGSSKEGTVMSNGTTSPADYNPQSKGGTTTQSNTGSQSNKNQSAMSVVLANKNDDNANGGGTIQYQSTPLSTGANRAIGSQESITNNEDGSTTYIAPNGKRYVIQKDANGNLSFYSLGGDTKGQQSNLSTDGGQTFINDIDSVVDYIRNQNLEDGINRSNVDNKDAVKGAQAEIVGTYNAPNGKEYDILEGTGDNYGKFGFININGEAQWFDTQDAALNYIDKNNPTGSVAGAKNEPLQQIRDRGGYNGEFPETGVESIDEANQYNQDQRDKANERLAQLSEELNNIRERMSNSSDQYERNLANIVQQSLGDLDSFTTRMDDAINDLKEKSDLLQDNAKMRWARQRAAQLAAKGYLTSEQVNQVANYSLSDYNKELEASAIEAAQAISKLRMEVEQKRQDALWNIRNAQFTNENNRINQENYVNDWAAKMLEVIDTKTTQADQYYGGLIMSNLQSYIQNELGYDSIVRQNEAQNVVDEQNQVKAYRDPVYKMQYILSKISDANLQPYAEALMKRDIQNDTFTFPNNSNESNKRILAQQIAAYTDAARQLQLENQKALNKVS